MKILRARLLKYASAVLAAAVVLSIPIKSNAINRLILFAFEKKFSKDIDFKSSKIWLPGSIFLEGVSLSDKNGTVCTANDLDIKYNLAGILLNNKKFFFKASDVEIRKNMNILSSVSNMLTIPETPDAEFIRLDGIVDFQKNAIYIENITAETDDIKIAGSGLMNRNGDLDCRLHFSFSARLLNNVPDAIKTALLTAEDEHWMGMTLAICGNYTRPSLRIDSETFRLNIREAGLELE